MARVDLELARYAEAIAHVVASAPRAAGVRVWQVMSGDEATREGPPPGGVDVGLYEAAGLVEEPRRLRDSPDRSPRRARASAAPAGASGPEALSLPRSHRPAA